MIGIDLLMTGRMELFLKRRGFIRGLQRFLSEDEIALVKNARTAAGFWAAKEACAKALGTGIRDAECKFNEIQISKTEKGAPILTLSPRIISRFNISSISVSISHHTDYAIAVVAIETVKD